MSIVAPLLLFFTVIYGTLADPDMLQDICVADPSSAIKGCQGVFHTASPVTNDPEQMVEPAVNGTKIGKAVAEKAAWEMAKEKRVDLVVVNPVLVVGPLLQPIVNASILHILKYLTGSAKTYANSVQTYVHAFWGVDLAHILSIHDSYSKALDLVPMKIHEQSPIFFGSYDDVEEIKALYAAEEKKACLCKS
ncbi:hypothetical protein IFM89_005572 [Coptis chinensis]|uniref:Cinnamoyl-CoA reductase n=1 Tax=Coptis chinensis TaxID=261450 RepID=A0A835IC19_9MAGN|nr:hypothetical protein IFM89_005572 [Coptis chinensis]